MPARYLSIDVFLNYMGKYNPARLNDYKYGLLGIYIADLQDLQKGHIPICFERHADFLREALPFFPDRERSKYQELLDTGLSQVQFLRVSHAVDALKEGEPTRKKAIENFLTDTL